MKNPSFLFAVLVAICFTAHSEVLVYDGFASSAYTIGSGGTGTLSGYPKVYNDTMTGLSEKTWQMNGSQPKVWGYGLKLPSTFAAAGIATKGEWSIGPNGGGSQKSNRDTSRDLISKLLNRTSGSLYFRVLMHLDKTAAAMLPTTSDTLIEGSGAEVNYWGVGFSPEWGTSYSMLNTTKGAFGFFFRKNKAGAVSLIFRGKGADGTKLERELCAVPAANTGLRDDNTYIAYAQIDINAGTDGGDVIFAGAQNITAYSATEAGEAFSQSIGELDLFNDTVYPNTLVFDGCYQTNGRVLFDEIGVATEATDLIDITFAGNPKISDIDASGHSGAYSVAATIIRASATDAGAIAYDGANAILHSYGAVDEGADFTKDFSLPAPADDKTYRLGAYAVNGEGGVTNFAATAYNGVLTLAKVKDADEYGLSAGEVTVSRANADPFPIDVAYAFSSDDGTGGKTWDDPTGPVTIPAGETSATIYLKPRLDVDVDKDIEVTVSLGTGNYLAGTAPVVLLLKTVAPPAGYNTWMAMSDGLASDAANWSLKHAPTADDNVLFDGNFSKANCEWDAGENGPSATIAALTVQGGYDGKIVVDTVYSGTFETFAVAGDVVMRGGTLSQKVNDTSTSDTYRLKMSVGGDLTVYGSAKIDVSGCGPHNNVSNKSIAYASDMDTIGSTWGDPKLPTACGKAGQNKSKAGGGGAIYLVVAGKTTLNGSMLADGVRTISNYATSENGWGCGGSIYLETGSFEGSGVVSASTPLYVKGDNSRGTSGRISVWSKTTASAFPVDNLRAWGDRQETDYNIGAGTVVVRNPGEANGTLYIRNNPDRNFSYNITVPQQTQTTSIPKGDTWTFDAVVLGNYGVLTVPDTAKLVLPNGFASVSCLNSGSASSSSRNWHCGLVVRDGGAVEAPAINGKHEFKGGRWTFCPCSTYTLTGDVEVSGGANIGVPLISQGSSNFMTCNVKVVGDMDVKSDGLVSAEYGGIGGTGAYASQGYVTFEDAPIGNGKANGTGHGGQKATFDGSNSYDSFFNPYLPGSAGGHADQRNVGGGVINLEVTGTLNVDGKISSSVQTFASDNHAGGAGSLNVRAGKLTGAGRIIANTKENFSDYAKASYGSYGGGRIAVRLTGAGSAFDDYWFANITAKGYSKTGALSSKITLASDDQRYSSAGSVYLQTAAESEKCGTIVIRNDGVAENTAWTSLPAAAETDDIADFKKASLSLLDCGKVRLYDTLQMANLTLAENCRLDLNGETLTVNAAKLGGVKVKPGTYAADDEELGGFVTDSAVGGGLVVKSGGLTLIVR